MASDGFVDIDEEIEENEAEPEEPINIHIINSQILDSKDYIDTYIINRNHIREQSKSVVPACGFLLTGAFGLIYFLFNGNSDKIPIHPIIIILLLLAAICLAASIVASIKSVQAASSSLELPETRDQQWDFIHEIYEEEYKWGNRSIQLLEIALIFFVFIIMYFSFAYLTGTPSTNNAPLEHLPNFIIVPFRRPF